MAIDPRISLAVRGPDVGGAFQNALTNVQGIQQMQQQAELQPLRNQLLQTQNAQAQQSLSSAREQRRLKNIAQTSLALKPQLERAIEAGDSSQVEAFLNKNIQDLQARQQAGEDVDATESMEALQILKTQGPQALLPIANDAISMAERLGVVGGVAQPSLTSLQKNVIASGKPLGSPEFQEEVQRQLEKPTGTQVVIGGDKKFQEKVAEGHAKTLGRITEESDAAIDANQSLAVLEGIDVETGALEPAKQGLAAFASAFGLDASNIANVAKGEAFNAEAQRLVLSVKASQKGPQTDKDEATIRSTVASLGNTKAGNQFIIDSARALNNRRIERKEFYDKFIEEAGGNFKDESGKTADQAWASFKRGTPMISSNLRTPEGLPVFFYKFEEAVRSANPDATKAEIIEFWKQQNKGKK